MRFFAKTSFVPFFLLVFSVTLVILASIQALFGTLRWYNSAEQKHENLQNYPIYSASDESTPAAVRVTIAPKPVEPTNVYVLLQNARDESRPEVIIQYPTLPDTKVPEVYQTPVQISVKPAKTKMPQGYPGTMDTILTGTYFRDVLWKFPLIVDNHRISPRGQVTNASIILSGRMKTTPEVAKVLVHELGHMVDIYFLKQKGRNPDPSKEYYAISWSEPTVLLSGITAQSFASGYAATNQYEDFAEAFTLYIFHNTTFAERAKSVPALQQKYDFLRNRVFGEHFIGTNFEQNPLPASLWDVTKIAIKSDAIRDIFVYLGLSTQTLV